MKADGEITIITIELLGSYTARHVESGLTVNTSNRRNRGTTKSAIGPLCRKLIEAGHDPAQKVHVIRKALDRDWYLPVFNRDRALSAWADVDCIESETRGPHTAKYRPLPVAVKAKSRREHLWVTELSAEPEVARKVAWR